MWYLIKHTDISFYAASLAAAIRKAKKLGYSKDLLVMIGEWAPSADIVKQYS